MELILGKKVALIVPVFNRPTYLLQCLQTLFKLNPAPSETIFVDDASTDPAVIALIESELRTQSVRHEENTGVRGAVKSGCDLAINYHDCDLAIVLDSDVIVKPDLIKKLVAFHVEHGNMTSAFNTHNIKNPVEETGDGCVFKKHVNGINLCFNKEQYEKYVLPSLEQVGNWDYNTSLRYQADNKLFTIITPSLVQHIGLISSMGHTNNGIKPDMAYDF